MIALMLFITLNLQVLALYAKQIQTNIIKIIISSQEDLLLIIFSEFISEEKIRENNSENMSVSHNEIPCISQKVKILMDRGASALIVHDSFIHTNKNNTRKTSANK